MDVSQILDDLQMRFGAGIDTGKITKALQGINLSSSSMADIISHLKNNGISLGDLDGDGVQESLGEELFGKAKQVFGGMFNK